MSSHAGDSASELNASPQSEPIHKVVRTKHGEFLLLGAEVLPPIPGSVPLEHLGPRWYLHEDVSQEWRELELALLRLRQFAHSVVSDLDSGRLLYPWLEPMRYGYAGGKHNDRTLGKKIMDSRAAFMLIMAEVTYNTARHRNFWDEVVLLHFGPHMTDLLKETWIACDGEGHGGYQPKDGFKRSLECVGLFMDADRCKFASAIAPMIRGCIPLWIKPKDKEIQEAEQAQVVPTAPQPRLRIAVGLRDLPDKSWLHQGKSSRHETPLAPGPSQIQEGGTWGSKPMQVEWRPLGPEPLFPPREAPKFVYEPVDKTEKHHRQRLRETWEEFFVHRAAKNVQMVEKELDESHQACLQREKHALKQMPPGSKGAAIFRWEHDHEKGYLLCKHVPCGQVEDAWMEFHDTQQCYNGFHNEWDLNREFDPTVRDFSDDEGGYEYDDLPLFEPYCNSRLISSVDDGHVAEGEGGDAAAGQIGDAPQGQSAHAAGGDMLQGQSADISKGQSADVAQAREELDWGEMGHRLAGGGISVIPEDIRQLSLETVLQWYHGIHFPRSPDSSLTALEKQKAAKCLRVISCQNVERIPSERANNKMLVECLEGFLSRRTSPHLPVEWTDFHPSSPDFVPKKLIPGFKVTKIILGHSDKFLYSITHDKETDYELVLEQATTVLLGLQQKGVTTLDEMTMALCCWGVRLSTCKQIGGHSQPVRTFLRAAERIPYQMKGFKPNMDNLQSYVCRRCELFRSTEVPRAALKHGRLIWQLAHDVEGSHSEELVVTGPSVRVTEIGDIHHTAEGDELWDEKLTDDQIDIICSIYKVEWDEDKGQIQKKSHANHRVQLTEDVSWFPKPMAWKGCGLDVSFWSADMESWYQHRIAKYIGGDFNCENQTQWRKSLKLCHDAPKVADALKAVSCGFLD
ncbi:hypothetical protein EDD18DRAFT_1346981 [Armillaria luteobubalina]|uniref:Uncharacterized protein n=1 Tax=Armillaria luteobubalina TaxID=153913 RepID=A0AA39QIR3_9AGAR|nr:hypothetical protein EDD18DRAFT_1346981 [Armillaria luteobubalina]